ncbi:MAG: M28 family peptidase [Nannocystales bacterium]
MIVRSACLAALLTLGACTTRMPGKSYAGPIPTRPPDRSERLMADVQVLAEEIGERNIQNPEALGRAADHVEQRFHGCGYAEVRRQAFRVDGQEVVNLEAVLPGTMRPDEVIVVGAHYDSAPGTPGADDNASGVAALLELACELFQRSGQRSIHWVAYVNEEPPYFQTAEMGSVVHANAIAAAGVNVLGMVSLETIGYYRGEPETQHYPFPMGAFYPKKGDFLAFVGNRHSKHLLRRAITVFREHAFLPSEGGLAPSTIQGVGWSDHWAYWQHGFAAIMVTDTAPFRNRNYHETTDTPETLDPERLALAVEGLLPVVVDLARVRAPS